jgi:hypothetical protein
MAGFGWPQMAAFDLATEGSGSGSVNVRRIKFQPRLRDEDLGRKNCDQSE